MNGLTIVHYVPYPVLRDFRFSSIKFLCLFSESLKKHAGRFLEKFDHF